MIPAFPVYLFDVDGTLVDSASDICGAIQTVLSKTSRPDVDEIFLKKYIGYHLLELFGDLFPEMSNDEIDRLICEYRTVYPTRDHRSTKLFPGVVEALSLLPGRKSTVTTKSTTTTRIVLERFGLISYFDRVQGTDGFPSKPKPNVVFAALEGLSARPDECLLVGDAAPDMEAGRRAGVRICGVRYGYGDPVKMAAFAPDYWIDDLRELIPSQLGSAPDQRATLVDG